MFFRLSCAHYNDPSVTVGVITSRVAKNITRVGGGSALGFGWNNLKNCPGDRFLNSARYLSEFFLLDSVSMRTRCFLGKYLTLCSFSDNNRRCKLYLSNWNHLQTSNISRVRSLRRDEPWDEVHRPSHAARGWNLSD